MISSFNISSFPS